MKAAIVAINNKCNVRCRFCVQHDSRGRNFSEQWIKNAIDTVKPDVAGVILYGGEPTLHPKFLEIGTYIKENALLSGFMSNGVLIDKFGGRIFDCFDFGFISLHGFKETHNFLTRSASWEKIIKNLAIFRERNLFKLVINITITKENLEDIDKFIIWLYEEFPYISLFNLNRIVKDGSIANFEQMSLNEDDYKLLRDKIAVLMENKVPIRVGIPFEEIGVKDCGTWIDISLLFPKARGCGSWDDISRLFGREESISSMKETVYV